MGKFVVYRLLQQSAVVEAESAEAAENLIETTTLWANSNNIYPSGRDPHPYVPPKIDLKTVIAGLPKPTMSGDELMALLRGGPELTLYWISYQDEDGTDKDLVVTAANPPEAFDLWGAYYFGEDWTKATPEERLELHNLTGEVEAPNTSPVDGWFAAMRIFEIKFDLSKAQALGWYEAVVPAAEVKEA